jgi:hypothetical protein
MFIKKKILNNPDLKSFNEYKHQYLINEAQNYGLYLKALENEGDHQNVSKNLHFNRNTQY